MTIGKRQQEHLSHFWRSAGEFPVQRGGEPIVGNFANGQQRSIANGNLVGSQLLDQERRAVRIP